MLETFIVTNTNPSIVLQPCIYIFFSLTFVITFVLDSDSFLNKKKTHVLNLSLFCFFGKSYLYFVSTNVITFSEEVDICITVLSYKGQRNKKKLNQNQEITIFAYIYLYLNCRQK